MNEPLNKPVAPGKRFALVMGLIAFGCAIVKLGLDLAAFFLQ